MAAKVFLAKHILTGEDVNIRIINKQLFKNDLLSMTRFNKELKIIKTVKQKKKKLLMKKNLLHQKQIRLKR